MKPRTLIALAAASALLATVQIATAAQTIVVGGKDFTEQRIMADMTAQLLKAKGYQVDERSGMGSTVLRKAMESGQVDVYWEYTGTSLIVYNKINKRMSPEEVYETVKKLDAKKGIVWLNPSKANNTFALAMRKAEADKLGIHTLSELAKAINGGKKFTFALDAEFYARPDGWKPLQKEYGFNVSRGDIRLMDPGLMYKALKDGQVNVGLVFATDGRIPAFHLEVLKDDKDFFPNYALTPVVRKDVLEKNPKLAEYLNALSAKLNDVTMRRLNSDVDVKKESIQKVAARFLKKEGLI